MPAAVQSLKNQEDFIDVLLLEADAVVSHAEYPLLWFIADRDVDSRRTLGAELDRVAQQILKDLRQLRQVGADLGQRIVRDFGAALPNRSAEIPQGGLEGFFGFDFAIPRRAS